MFIPATFLSALLLTILSACCWGSFANTFKLTKNYRFELYYWDYGLGIFLTSLVYALTFGSRNGGLFSFLPNMHQALGISLFWAAFGGFVFNIANVLLIAGIEMVGLAIAFPLSIGIALVEGTVLAYAIHPGGNPTLLFAGVGMGLVAVILIGLAYASRGIAGAVPTRKGIIVCLISGVLMGSWAPALAKAASAVGTGGVTITPYTSVVFMTLGAFICCFIFNPILMRKPLIGTPVTMAGYFGAPASYHVWGLLGGFIWGTGTVFNVVAGGKVGLPIAYAIGQSAPMIATLWGVLVWKEFAGAAHKSKVYLGGMIAAYLAALALIALAYTG